MSDHLCIPSLMQCTDVQSNYMTIWLIMVFFQSFLQTYNHLCLIITSAKQNSMQKYIAYVKVYILYNIISVYYALCIIF